MARRLAFCVSLLATVALAACGGGTTSAPSAVPSSLAGGGTTRPAAASAAGGGGATAAATAQPGAVGGAAALNDPCGLLTVAEAAGAMGTDPLTSSGTAGDPATCSYTLGDGEEALAIDVLRNGAAAQYQSFVDNGSAEDVSGIGDAALYERGTRRLLFKVSDLLIYVFPRYVNGADAALGAATAMAKIIAARLTTGSVPPELQITAPPIISAETACDLLSADEAASVLAKGPMSAQGNQFTPQFCTYAIVSSGEVVLSTFFQPKGGAATFAGIEGSGTTDPVSGLGDKAMFEPGTGILFVLKGDTLLNVNVFGQEPAATLDLDRQLAEVMLTHL